MRVATSRKLLEKFTKHPTPVVETDWERFFCSLNIFFLFKYYGSAHLTQVGKWPEHNFCRSWSSLRGGWLAGIPCLVVWPCGCRPGGWTAFRSWQLFENRKSPEDSFWSIGSCGHPTGQTPSGQGWPVEDLRILNNLHLSSFQQLLSCSTVPIVYRYSYTYLANTIWHSMIFFIYLFTSYLATIFRERES